uniref:Uncharacterized protein n=1 Tax=Bursaphelenchus xylophilus TaxID=6326 RepID=A0A1I7RZG4_BURXY
MSGYKRFVVNFTSWDFLFSLSLGHLLQPELIFPYNGAYVNGLFKYLGEVGAKLSLVFIINTACHMLSTQVYCLFFRYAILQNSPKLLDFTLSWATWIRGWIIAFAITTSAGIFIFAPMQRPQTEVRAAILELSQQFEDPHLPDFSRIIHSISK